MKKLPFSCKSLLRLQHRRVGSFSEKCIIRLYDFLGLMGLTLKDTARKWHQEDLLAFVVKNKSPINDLKRLVVLLLSLHTKAFSHINTHFYKLMFQLIKLNPHYLKSNFGPFCT